MGRAAAAIAGALALLGAGLLAGASIADGGSARSVAEPILAEPLVADRPLAQAAGKRTPTIQFYYASRSTVPPELGSTVQPVRCPRGAGQPISGGARTSQGIDIVYLSRAHPATAQTPRRTYFVGLEDVSDTNPAGAGALVEVACARNIRVRASG